MQFLQIQVPEFLQEPFPSCPDGWLFARCSDTKKPPKKQKLSHKFGLSLLFFLTAWGCVLPWQPQTDKDGGLCICGV